MKLTASLPDEMIREAMKLSGTATITDALKTALAHYISFKKSSAHLSLLSPSHLSFTMQLRNFDPRIRHKGVKH